MPLRHLQVMGYEDNALAVLGQIGKHFEEEVSG